MNRIDTVRANINKAVEESKKSRMQVTKEAGISYAHITRFLNNTYGGELSISILQKLSEALGVPVSYFLGDTDAKGHPILSSGGEPLPTDWDIVFKRIIKLPPAAQEKILLIISLALDGFEQSP